MKILQINKLYYPVIGGIETIVKDIAEGLNNKDDLKVDVLACQKKGEREIEYINGVKAIKTYSFGKALGMPLSLDFFYYFFKIRKEYDLFLLHYPFPLASIISMFIPKEKLVILYHSDIVRQKIGKLAFLPFINSSLNRAKKIIVSGNNIINSSSSLRKHKEKCVVVPFGLDFSFTENDKEQAEVVRKRYPNKKMILCIGRLVYYKGFEYAIKAMKDIEANLIIIGEGPEENKLKELIKINKLDNRVFILPPQSSLAPYFLASDIFLFPSCARSEAFGIVQLEALAAGKPIINTYLQTAVEEVSVNGETGITVQTKNPEEISKAVNSLLNNEVLYEKYSKNALNRYLLYFTSNIFIEKIKKELLN